MRNVQRVLQETRLDSEPTLVREILRNGQIAVLETQHRSVIVQIEFLLIKELIRAQLQNKELVLEAQSRMQLSVSRQVRWIIERQLELRHLEQTQVL